MEAINSITRENIATRRGQINERTPLIWTNLIKSPAEITATASVANNLMLDAVLKNQQEIMTKLGVGEKFTATA